MTDPYLTLGVPRTASADEIKRAYRKLAKKYHPDRNLGDEAAKAKYADVDAAYKLLDNLERKANFDRTGVVDELGASSLAPVMAILGPILLTVLDAFTKQGSDITRENIVSHMRSCIEQNMREGQRLIAEQKKLKAIIEASIERFTAADGEENLLQSAAKVHLAHVVSVIGKNEAQQIELQKALDYLKTCGYTVDKILSGLGSTSTNWMRISSSYITGNS